MIDVQKSEESRGIRLNRVGVTNVRFPFSIPMKDNNPAFNTIADMSLTVSVEHDIRGSHLSRFMEILNGNDDWFDLNRIEIVLQDMLTILEAQESFIHMNFPIFIPIESPVTKISGLMGYDCEFSGMLSDDCYEESLMGVKVGVQTLCPCSKEISVNNAHNQRCIVNMRHNVVRGITYEDMITLIEKCASSRLYPILKREDEKFVTEYSYEHPKFVEDIVRDVVSNVPDEDIYYLHVSATSQESIHPHNAYAEYEKGYMKHIK